MVETYTAGVQDYTVTSANDGSVVEFADIPADHKRAVRNAVRSGINHLVTDDSKIISIESGLVKETGTPPEEWDISVTVKTENQCVSTETLNEIKAELEQTASFETLSLSVQSRTREVEVDPY